MSLWMSSLTQGVTALNRRLLILELRIAVYKARKRSFDGFSRLSARLSRDKRISGGLER